jgi:serine/threonine-protein kinase
LFDAVADLSVTERARYFADHQVNPSTRQDVEELLAFDGASDTPLERQVGQVAAAALDHIEQSGRRYGPYRLGDLLGRGGMGVVYSAERIDGEMTRKVAVKLLQLGADSPTIRKRFLAERQIMASLNHPGIAALLDAGHTSDGQPYLVMDYIDGVPIHVYARNLDVRSALQLFVRVCEAVSYAHQNLIVHRDIKPSNILVDKSGQPKLLDFGIAKLLENEDHSTATLLTREGGGVLTAAYAAPEQISGGQVTTGRSAFCIVDRSSSSGRRSAVVRGNVQGGSRDRAKASLGRNAARQTSRPVPRRPGHNRRKGAEKESGRALRFGRGAGRRRPPLSGSSAD